MEEIRHEDTGQRGAFFILHDGERIAEMTYRRASPALIIVDHTEVAPRLRGQGVARRLLDAAAQWARSNQIKLGATCSYVVVQLARDKSLLDIRG
jgi:predicted GNAT family acetyltransferase